MRFPSTNEFAGFPGVSDTSLTGKWTHLITLICRTQLGLSTANKAAVIGPFGARGGPAAGPCRTAGGAGSIRAVHSPQLVRGDDLHACVRLAARVRGSVTSPSPATVRTTACGSPLRRLRC